MKSVKLNQIVGTSLIFFLFAAFTFVAINTKDTTAIIVSIVLGLLFVLFTLNSIKVIKEENGQKVKHNINYGYFICLIIICSIFGAFLTLMIKDLSFKSNAIKTTALIYDINKEIKYETKYDEDGNSYQEKEEICDLYIRYYVNDEEYNKILDNNSCKYSTGDDITIYYGKDDPNSIESESSAVFIFATLFSGGFLIVFIIETIKSLPKKKYKKK